jgi:hypothetical protein
MAAERRGVDVYRFNTEEYPASVRLSLDPADPPSANLFVDDQRIELGQAKGIWIRRPQWPVISAAVTDRYDRALAHQEALAAMGGAWRCLANRCVSPPDVLQAARWKLPQINLAARLGLPVPQTRVTQDAEEIRTFQAAGRTVMKAVGEAWVVLDGGERVGETTELLSTDDVRGAIHTPVLVQRLVEKVADWRVTMVGQRFFSVRMVAPDSAPIDIRTTSTESIKHEVRSLPARLESRLLGFAHHYGLRYGAFDLAEDAGGTLWFLECNPAGQWAWLEPLTGLKITDALIDLLLDPAR